MNKDMAADTSPFGVIVNRTGTQPTMAYRDADGYWAEFQRDWSGEWLHAPSQHAAYVGVDPDAWEPLSDPADLPSTLARPIA